MTKLILFLTIAAAPALSFAAPSSNTELNCRFSKQESEHTQITNEACQKKSCFHVVMCSSGPRGKEVPMIVTCTAPGATCSGYTANDCVKRSGKAAVIAREDEVDDSQPTMR